MRLLVQTEAAEFLRLSPRTLERYRVSGTGPRYCKLGRRIAYREADLEAWIAARVVGSTSEIIMELNDERR
jgi:predicted DNA-binding transcriptional regulator AlpA